MTRVLVKIYEYTKHLDGSEDRVLYQAFDREFENSDEAHEWSHKYCLNLIDEASDGMITYTYKLSNHEDDLELCDFFDKCLKYAVQTAINNPELAKKIYVEKMTPESVKQAYDDYNNEYEYEDEE